MRRRSTRWPAKASSAGSSVTDAAIDDQDGEADRQRDAVEEGGPSRNRPEEGDDDRRAGDEHAAAGGGDRLDDGSRGLAAEAAPSGSG